jgi:hypothetical protein
MRHLSILYKSLIFKAQTFKKSQPMVRFFKTNWFYIGLITLLLIGLFKKNILRIEWGHERQEQPERYTQTNPANPAGSASFLGLLSNGQSAQTMPQIDEAAAKAFLLRFGKVTKGEHDKFGIPASVLLACAYVNSFGGTRELANSSAHNYFAMPCGSDWSGENIHFNGRCYRQYTTPWESFRDASKIMVAQPWCQEALKQKKQDWEAWVDLLDKHGFSDVESAREEMRKVIKAYRLFELD